MTGHELRQAMAKLKLTTSAVAQMLGINQRTVFKWLAYGDQQLPSRSVAIIMSMLLRGKATFEDMDA